jgi:2-dehydro-3-deoxyphosphooctonate aldolase (KDO 8-P synthase)
VIESEKFVWRMARKIAEICAAESTPFIFKASYDKANRTSVRSFRGIGAKEGCEMLSAIGRELNVPVTTDVHSPAEAAIAGESIDVLQIPAFLCRQTDLLRAAAETKRVLNVKKGQFLAPWDMKNVIAKVTGAGNPNVLVTERGASFGYNTLVVDMTALPEMAKYGAPIVMDATHAVQKPGGAGDKSGGNRDMAPYIARAAVAVGVAAVFMETHQDPDNAPSDGPNMIRLKDMPAILDELVEIDRIAKKRVAA